MRRHTTIDQADGSLRCPVLTLAEWQRLPVRLWVWIHTEGYRRTRRHEKASKPCTSGCHDGALVPPTIWLDPEKVPMRSNMRCTRSWKVRLWQCCASRRSLPLSPSSRYVQ